MRTRLQLLQPHTHAGKECRLGDVIEVDPDIADWLVSTRVAKALPEALHDSTDSQPEPVSDTGSPLSSKEKRR